MLINQPAFKIGLLFETDQRLRVRGQIKQYRFLQLDQQRAVQAQTAVIDTVEYRLRDPQIRSDLARRCEELRQPVSLCGVELAFGIRPLNRGLEMQVIETQGMVATRQRSTGRAGTPPGAFGLPGWWAMRSSHCW